jgi:hypothetical protein
MKAVYQRPYAIDLVFTHADGRKSWLVLHPQTGDDSCIIADWGAGEDDFRDTIDEVVLQNDPDAIIDDLVRN